jgi:hypothetical protein
MITKLMLPLQERLSDKLFIKKQGQIHVVGSIMRLLAGPDLSAMLNLGHTQKYIPAESLSREAQKSIGLVKEPNGTIQIIPFDFSFKVHVEECCDREYNEYQHYYEKAGHSNTEEIVTLAKTHALLRLIFRHFKDPKKLSIMFESLNTYMHGTKIPTTSFDAFRKYISRKNKKKLPDCLIHGLISKPSNHGELSDFMKDVIVLLATKQTILLSAKMIEKEIIFIGNELHDASSLGFYVVSESTIQKFLSTAHAQNAINYSLAEPLDFQKRVLGVLRFVRASAGLVKVHVDAYYFQMQYKDVKGMNGLVGIFFYDENSEFLFTMNIDGSENANSLKNAFKQFFVATKGQLPREFSMDTFTYKLMVSGMPKLHKFLIDKGVKITKSTNPNNKSHLERFFGTLQQRDLPKSIYYLGPGIKSKKRLSHPARAYRLILSSARFALDKYDLSRILSKLCYIDYNAYHVGPDFLVPKERYEKNGADPLTTVDAGICLPYLFYEYHYLKVEGGTIEARMKSNSERGKNREEQRKNSSEKWVPRVTRPGNIYKNRELSFLNLANEQYFDVYINPDEPITAFLYTPGGMSKVGEMRLFKRLPSAEHDRDENDLEQLSRYHHKNQSIRLDLEKADNERSKKFKDKVGKEIQGLLIRSAEKKEMEDVDMALQIGLTEKKEAPQLVNLNKSRRVRRLRSNDSAETGIIFNDTI